MSQPLFEQELLEANTQLFRFLRIEHNYALLLGGVIVCGPLAILGAVLQVWFTESGSLAWMPFVAVWLVLIGLVTALLRRLHVKLAFRQVQSHAVKLQRAGFVLYKKPVFSRDVLGASTEELPQGAVPLNFESLSPHELRHIFS